MKDIDPHKMLIRIERSVTYAKAKTIIGDPKTEAGFRHMLMLPKLWDVLALTPGGNARSRCLSAAHAR